MGDFFACFCGFFDVILSFLCLGGLFGVLFVWSYFEEGSYYLTLAVPGSSCHCLEVLTRHVFSSSERIKRQGNLSATGGSSENSRQWIKKGCY